MKLQEIEREAISLTEEERVSLVLSLMETLVSENSGISDEDALRRDAELESGMVAPMSHEEFARRVQQERRG